MEQHFTAFISYRHASPDDKVARWLHSAIETYHIPASVQKQTGMKRMGRCFRDEEELPLSPDLGDDIERALDGSDWLVAVCTPRYLESKWCMRELEYFAGRKGREHILAVLADGRPAESFPDLLRWRADEAGNRVPYEPLAAEARGATMAERVKKLRVEKFRLLAPMLGVGFDDLRQRARRRRTRVIASAAAAVIVLLSGFLGYAIKKNAEITRKNEEITAQNQQITEQNGQITAQNRQITAQNEEIIRQNGQIAAERNEALISESKWLAKSADEALESGDKMLSLLLSLEALPEDFDDPERPVTDEALAALRTAIFSGMGDNRYHSLTTIEVPGLEQYRGGGNVLYCFSRQSEGFITAWDLNTGKPLEPGYTLSEEPISFYFDQGLDGYCVYSDRIERGSGTNVSYGIRARNDDGTFVMGEAKESYSAFDALIDGFRDGGSGYLLLQGDGVFSGYQIYGAAYRDYAAENAAIADERNRYLLGFCTLDAKPIASLKSGQSCYVIGGYSSTRNADEAPAILMVNALASGYDADNVLRRYYMDGEIAPKNGRSGTTTTYYSLSRLDVNCDCAIIAGYDAYGIYFWRAAESQMASAFDMALLGGGGTKIVKAAFSGADRSLIAILADSGRLCLYDCAKETVVRTVAPGLANITDFQWNTDSTQLLLTCDDDAARIVSAADGELLQTIPCAFPLEKAEYGRRDDNDNSADDTYVLLRGGDRIQVCRRSSLDPALSISGRINDQAFTSPDMAPEAAALALSADEATLWTATKDGIAAYDTETLERRAGFFPGVEYLKMAVCGQSVYVWRPGNSSGDPAGIVHVLDTETLEETASFRSNYPHRYLYLRSDGSVVETDRSEHLSIGAVRFSEDGSLALLDATRGSKTYQQDLCVFVYRTDDLSEAWHIGFDGGNAADKIFDFAADWSVDGGFELHGWFLPGSGRVLCRYSYGDMRDFSTTYNGSAHMAFELRDAETGAAEQTWFLPYTIAHSAMDAARGVLLAQDTEYTVHLVELLTGKELAAVPAETLVRDFWIGTDAAYLWFAMPGAEDDPAKLAADAVVLSYDGAVRTAPSAELHLPAEPDGLFGETPFFVGEDGLYAADAGAAILKWDGNYRFLTSFARGQKQLLYSDGELVVVRCAEPAELRALALRILDGRTLTDAQRAKYFLG